jgi:hypothetical protein
MPRGDGTGPNGMGPMTGRAAGYCAGFTAPGAFTAPGVGRRGLGRRMGPGGGRGRGLGQWNFRRGPGAPAMEWLATGYPSDEVGAGMDRDQELAVLKQQAMHLTESLDTIRQRIEELAADEQDN